MENKSDRFKRLATYRTNQVIKALKILGNCSNKQIYEYEDEQINKIFSVIDKKVKEVKGKFHRHNEDKFRL